MAAAGTGEADAQPAGHAAVRGIGQDRECAVVRRIQPTAVAHPIHRFNHYPPFVKPRMAIYTGGPQEYEIKI